MARACRLNGRVALYVWDYAGEMQFMRHFWDAAAEIDPAARELDEGVRFPIANSKRLWNLFLDAGLNDVTTRAIDVPTHFRNFDDFWTPFLGGQGPAPGYGRVHPSRRARIGSQGHAMNPNLEALLDATDRAMTARRVDYLGPVHVGVDLGTAFTVLLVLDENCQPLAGTYRFAEVVRDGLVVDFIGAIDLLKELKHEVEARVGFALTHAATGYPPGVPRAEVRATANVLHAAGLECTAQIKWMSRPPRTPSFRFAMARWWMWAAGRPGWRSFVTDRSSIRRTRRRAELIFPSS
jgi:hypothetical protein